MAEKRRSEDKQTYKGKKKHKTSTESKNSKTSLAEEEVDFPRGGASALSPLEVRKIKQEAEKDVLFGTQAEEPKKKKKTKSKSKLQQEESKIPLEYESTRQIKHVENLSFKRLSPGIKLLGAVKDVSEFEVVISLPNGLSGFVNIVDVNDKITEMLTSEDDKMDDDNDDTIPSLEELFHVNDLVVCVIKEIIPEKHGHKKIKLSVKPEDINSGLTTIMKGMVLNGYVSSEEDHGYIISFGVKGKTGFLPKKSLQGDLRAGQPLQVFVKSGDEARVVSVTIDKEKITSAMVTEEMNCKLSNLVPGMMVKMTVKDHDPNGLLVSFLDVFEGVINLNHLPDHGGDGQDLEKKYKKKSKIVGRVLFINLETKVVALSAQPAIVQYKPKLVGGLTFGDIIDEATVVRVDQEFGLLLKLTDDIYGYAHISHISDSHLEKLGKKFKPGTEHTCRVVGFNAVDGLVSLSLKKSVIEKPFLRYHDIKVGSVIECSIMSLEKFGMLVSLSNNIKGLVTNLHLADITLKHPEKKLTEGKEIKCRVLEVDPEKRRLQLTHKKTLVTSDLPIITSYSDVKVGMATHGFISSIRETCCFVTFYNNIKGLIPKGELGIQPQEDPRQVFYVGQVLKCYVINCQPEEKKMKLSLKASSTGGSSQYARIQPASIVDVDVVATSNEGLDVQVTSTGLPALLPISHLSDFPGNYQALKAAYSPSQGKALRVNDVLYYGQDNNKHHLVSLKSSLKSASQKGQLLKSFDDVKVDMVLTGFVKQIMPYGIFVEFAPRIFGLAPNSFLANQFVADASSHFEIGQSVIAKVMEINEERKRFLVSLKQSDLMPESISWDPCGAGGLVLDYLKEQQFIKNSAAEKSDEVKELLSHSVGSYVEAKVKSVKKHGITLQLAGGIEAFVTHQLAEGVSCNVGEVVYGVVLDHNINTMTLDVVLLPDIVQEAKKHTKIKKLKQGQIADSVVLLVKKNYVIVYLPHHHCRIAIAPAQMHLNDIRDASKRYAVKQKYSATVHSNNPLVVVLEDKSIDKENIKPGSVTSAIVKTVKAMQMNVQLEGCGLSGRVHVSHVTDEIKEGHSPLQSYHQGNKVKVKVLGFRDFKTHHFLPITHKNFTKAVAELSLKQSDLSSTGTNFEYHQPKLDDYKVGDKVTAFVKSVTDHCIWMVISEKVTGRVALLDASTDVHVLAKLSHHFKPGSGYTCHVLSIDSDHDTLVLSIAYKPEDKLCKGMVVPGCVSKVVPTVGVFLQLPFKKYGMAGLTDILDHYTDSPTENIHEKQIVKCHVLDVKENGNIDLSLRPSRTRGESTKDEAVDESKPIDPEYESILDLDIGQLVKGYVKSIGNAGVFVSLSRQIVARIQIKNLSHFFVKDWKPLFPPGKLVTGKVLSINPSDGRIELSLKGKDTGLADPAPNPKKVEKEKAKKRKREAASKKLKTVKDKDDGDNEEEENEGGDGDEEVMLKKLKGDSDSEEENQSESESEDSDEETSSEEQDSGRSKSQDLPRLQVTSGFDWNAVPQNNGDFKDSEDESSDSDTEQTDQVSRKKTKRQKRAEKKAEEDFLYKTEQALLDQDRAPESTDDFDRLVLTSPNNSVLWLQYMAFHLHITEIDKARAVAERAIKTISFREEREKLNIWVALMNLENLYGTQDSLVKVFERALQQNDPKKVFFHLISIYVKSDKNELAEQLFHAMTKRFSQSKKVWIEFGRYYMKCGKLESARKMLQRALKSLPARKHVDTIVQFALMEFKLGDPQRGQTVMEEVLSNYPKRSDIWSVYIDMMIKQGDNDVVRNIFERVIHINLSSKKMKFLFKRYLAFEREHGDEMSVENVKTKAMEYVESKVAIS